MAADALPRTDQRAVVERTSLFNLSAIGSIAIWSGTAPFSKYALREFPVLAYTIMRPVFGIAILAAILLYRHQRLTVDRKDLPLIVVTGMIGIGASQLTYTGALDRTSVAHTVIIASMSPLFVAAYRLAVKHQRLPGRSLFGLFGGFVGVVVLMLGSRHSTDTSLVGDLLALISAVTWMGATMWPVRLIKKYGSLRTNLWMFGSSLLTTAPFGIWFLPDVFRETPSPLAWAALLYAAVFGMVTGNVLWQRAVQQLGGARTLVYLYLQPVGAMLIAALVLGERLSPLQAAGGVIALVGVALVRKE
jgi:drug/metabolite transporter (DMT)-like permease